MATVTRPPILDSTGQQIATKLQSIKEAISSSGGQSGSKLTITTSDVSLYEHDVTVSIGGSTYTGTFSSSGEAVINGLLETGTASITITDGTSTQVDSFSIPYFGNYTYDCWLGERFDIVISTEEPTLFGKAVTVTNGTSTYTATFSNAGIASVTMKQAGTYTVTASDGSETATATVNVVSGTTSYTVELSLIPKKTFSAATTAEIVKMVEAADAGKIDLYTDCGWRVGQEHTITLGAIAASGTYDGVSWTVGETHESQSVTFVLMHKGLYTLVNPVKDTNGNNRTTCSFVVGLKECLTTNGYMNSINDNAGSWNGSARRNWCNGGFRQAVPVELRAVFKKFNTLTAQTYNGTTNQTSQDYFALPAAAEVYKGDETYGTGGTAGKTTAYSNLTEFNALTQFTYYATSSNRIKKNGLEGSAYYWWERSPFYDGSTYFCRVVSDGSADGSGASSTYGLAPFGCL